MQDHERLQIFIKGAGLTDSTEAVYFGNVLAPYIPSGVEAVMKEHCSQVDTLLQKLPKGNIKEIELFATRGFTMQEYEALFDLTIREKEYMLYPVFRSLWLLNENERRKLIYPLQKQNFNDYWQLLASHLARFNPHLLTFFFQSQYSC